MKDYNKIPLSEPLLKALEVAARACPISASSYEKEAKKDPECGLNEYYLQTAEECRLAKVVIEDFIYRATHDDYGALI
jgi:hypothetical protein